MPRRNRRTKDEITYDILATIKETRLCNQARIQLKANLNFYQAKTFLQHLITREFITEKDDIYFLLDRGKQWINQYEILRSLSK